MSREDYKSSALYEVRKFITLRALLELIPGGSVVTLVARRDAQPGYIEVEDDYEPVPLDQRVDKVRKK